MAVMYEKVVDIVSKDPSKRKPQEVDMMLPWFRKKAAVFASLSTEIVADIIRNCEFKTVHRDHVIIKQGDIGDCFYIILRGKVSIFINNLISDEDDTEGLSETTQELLKAETKTAKGELDRSKFGNYIAPIDEGKSFGELALISKECIRNASIIADQTTDLVVVNRELYNRSLRSAQEAEFNERNSFVQNNPLFKNWQYRYKKQMAFSIKRDNVPFDGVIAKQGDPVECLYFIQKGQAKIVVDPNMHEAQYPNLYPLEDLEDTKKSAEEEHLGTTKKDHLSLIPDTTTLVTPSAGRKRESRRKCLEMSIVGTNEVIGDVEFILDLKSYSQSAISTEPCQLYTLDMKNYERLVVRKNRKTVEMIREQAEIKINSRLSRLPEKSVPFLKFLSNRLKLPKKPSSSKKGPLKPVIFSAKFSDMVPERGAIVDLFGPGTIFYRNRMREKASKRIANKGAHIGGANVGRTMQLMSNMAPTQGANYMSNNYYGGEDDNLFSYKQNDDSRQTKERNMEDIDPNLLLLEANSFKDYESSNRVMTDLEDRINAWITRDITNKRIKPHAVKLHRLDIDENKQLKPGKKVIFQRKQNKGPIILQQGTEFNLQETSQEANDRQEKDYPSVHGAGVSRPEEAAGLAPSGTHHLFVTSPPRNDDMTFARQRSMPETHALQIVCGSVNQNGNTNISHNNYNYNTNNSNNGSIHNNTLSPNPEGLNGRPISSDALKLLNRRQLSEEYKMARKTVMENKQMGRSGNLRASWPK